MVFGSVCSFGCLSGQRLAPERVELGELGKRGEKRPKLSTHLWDWPQLHSLAADCVRPARHTVLCGPFVAQCARAAGTHPNWPAGANLRLSQSGRPIALDAQVARQLASSPTCQLANWPTGPTGRPARRARSPTSENPNDDRLRWAACRRHLARRPIQFKSAPSPSLA